MNTPWQLLQQFYAQQKIPHALLLLGSPQAQKEAIAQAFVKLLLCQKPDCNTACGQCQSCHLYDQHTHPDVRHLGQEDQTVGIEEIRAATSFLQQTAHQQRYKAVILYQADKLQLAAGNALLKSLEEPPAYSSYLLLAQTSAALLSTIKSRCVIIPLPVPADQPIDSHMPLITALEQATVHAFYQEEVQQLITAKPLQALYLMYQWVAAKLCDELQSAPEVFNTQVVLGQRMLAFLDKVNEAIALIALPGTNKILLFESLFYHWQGVQPPK